jgi:hypothetical protein
MNESGQSFELDSSSTEEFTENTHSTSRKEESDQFLSEKNILAGEDFRNYLMFSNSLQMMKTLLMLLL